jgi:hypothetical protein
VANDPDNTEASATAYWIWFGVGGDSIDITTPRRTYIATSEGQERDSNRNTANRFRRRLTGNGIVEIFFDVDEIAGDSVPYTLSIVHEPEKVPAALRATGQTATLILSSSKATDRLSLIPISMGTAPDRSKWSISARNRYRVAPVADTLYELCKLPCSRPDTIKLTPSATVTKHF